MKKVINFSELKKGLPNDNLVRDTYLLMNIFNFLYKNEEQVEFDNVDEHIKCVIDEDGVTIIVTTTKDLVFKLIFSKKRDKVKLSFLNYTIDIRSSAELLHVLFYHTQEFIDKGVI